MPEPRLPIAKAAEIHLRGTSPGGTWENVLGFQTPEQLTPDFAALLGAEALSHLALPLMACMSVDWQLTSIRVNDVLVPEQVSWESGVNPPIPGNIGGQASPSNAATVVSWRTAYAGRRNRGRTYVGGIPEEVVAQDQVDGPHLGRLAAFADAVRTFMVDTGYSVIHAVLSRKFGLYKLVTSYIIDRIVDSQRRRLKGRGA
uniref:Uncharacterized protein n=1 Tax=uncultured prokaryote TaxID=198431 RepID=A0A0H5QGH5_9ZZZZ|nr:hypothetical protein [uncultured prokaryote]